MRVFPTVETMVDRLGSSRVAEWVDWKASWMVDLRAALTDT